MTEFLSPYGEIKLTVSSSRDGSLLRLGLSATSGDGAEPGYGVEAVFNADLVPGIAAAVIEKAGFELREGSNFAYGIEQSLPCGVDGLMRDALWSLKRALAIREYHAKPRVTQAQVEAVRLGGDLSSLGDISVHDVLQAALDSGVLQVPADNKEGDR